MDLSDPYFGVIEVPNSTSSTRTPGYAMVPDTGYDPSKVALQPTGRKRLAATKSVPTTGEVTSRQQAAILKHLQELDRDDSRDVKIEAPKKKDGHQGKKTTTNVSRILKSEKNWGHHLADEEALKGQQPGQTNAATASRVSTAGSKSTHRASLGKQPSMSQPTSNPTPSSSEDQAPPPPAAAAARPLSQDPLENDPLLRTYAPAAPSAALMAALVSAPPLSYNQARAAPSKNPTQRHYCVMCGYWGRVKCIKCGGRVCGMGCKREHDAECGRMYA